MRKPGGFRPSAFVLAAPSSIGATADVNALASAAKDALLESRVAQLERGGAEVERLASARLAPRF
jgi:hypothetical protein